MATFISHSVAETENFGARLAAQAKSGWLLGLVGDLGAGKTHFVKGFARGLGVTEPVLSPSFALLHVYMSGALPMFHIDFYRLHNAEQILGAGLGEYFAPAGVTLIEWWDRWTGPRPPGLRLFTFDARHETERCITYDDSGA